MLWQASVGKPSPVPKGDLRAVKLQMRAKPPASLGQGRCCEAGEHRCWSKRKATGLCHYSLPWLEKVRNIPPSREELGRPPLFPFALSTLWGSRSSAVGLLISFTMGSCRV